MTRKLENMRYKEIPVYIFTGFLGAGKTTFINETLATPEFDGERRTLLLICEQGEIEYEPDKFAADNVIIEVIEDEDALTRQTLDAINAKYDFDQVLLEYNGMWLLRDFLAAMPRGWVIAQEMCFMDATTFLMYNTNMRQQCFDKMQTAELLVFNRCQRDFDKMEFHKQARIASRRSQIVYEYGPYEVELDDIEDELPYDKTAKSIAIAPEWYAEWYRDINDHPETYEGKTIKVKGRVALAEELPDGKMAFGRHVMTCCIEDIEFAGLMCIYANADEYKTGDWVEITAKVRNEYQEAYGEKGPVLYAKQVERCEPTDPEVATF